MYRVICFDFDDVIVDTNLCLQIGERFGNKVKELKFLIDFLLHNKKPREFSKIAHQAAKLIRGLPFKDLKKLADHLRLTPGVRETFKQLKKEGYKILIVSANDERIIQYLLKKHSLNSFVDKIFASKLVTNNGTLTGEIRGEVIRTEKVGVIHEIESMFKVTKDEINFVADGITDIPIFKKLGHGIFFCPSFATKSIIYRDRELAELEKNRKIFLVEKKNLQEVLPYIDEKFVKKRELHHWYQKLWHKKFVDEKTRNGR
ncbi:MAG: HAD family phosphatase [Candidatus Aenigmarchaeota archaeon]|nr:HAD family phosphatase [Candidatus Aenigmarchaeota archaeon]